MSCAPVWDDLCIEQGETLIFVIDDHNLDLTTDTAADFTVTDTLDGTTIMSGTLAGGEIVLADGTDGAPGVPVTYNIQITIPAATTAAADFSLTNYGYYRVSRTQSDGVVVYPLRGRVKLKKDV